MRTNDKTRNTAAIAGAGAAGLLHALSYRAHGVDVAFVFDPNPSQARCLAELCGATLLDDIGAVASADVDFVSVCSPPAHHVEQALACAREGRFVFIEKPLAVSRSGFARIAGAPGCIPIVQWRWGRAIRAVKRAIALGLLGDAPSVSVDLAWGRDEAYFRSRAGWGCGALLSVGIHAIDVVCYALDRSVVAVSSALRSAGVQIARRHSLPPSRSAAATFETSGSLIATFEGGASAAIRATLEGGPDETRLSFCGGGVTAAIVGSEADPTASSVVWRCENAATLRRLREVELSADGAVQSPLIVPYMGRAIEATRRGIGAGGSDECPGVGDVAAAHELLFRALEQGT
jgi:predicted dehydrogenase